MRVCGLYTQDNYEFELCECGVETALERVKNRDSDMGIVMYSQFQEKKLRSLIQPNDLTVRELFTGDFQVRVGVDSPLAGRESISASDLEGLFRVEKTHWLEGMFSLDFEMEYMGVPRSGRRLLVNGNKTYHEALSQLPSYSVGPSWSCKWSVGKDLKRIPFQGPKVLLTCGVISRKNELLKEEYENFIQHLIEAYGG
ncbi:MAG: LysR family transcriptional regulator substrate-binding protein [Oscillospiraceae bacterium]|nr:LysR family transcriptional regulator substrate-binding protein [Oscillospiraceae bacterium]